MIAVRAAALVLVVVMAGGSRAMPASGPEAVLVVEPSEGTIGDALGATLTVHPGPGERVEATPLGPEIGDVTVLSGAWIESPSNGSPARWHGTIAAYRVGAVTIPEVDVVLVGPSGRRVVRTAPVTLTVKSTLPRGEGEGEGVAEIADLKPPATIPPDYRRVRTALAALAVLAAASALGWWLWRRYAPRLASVPAPVDPFRRLPPHVWAAEEIEALLARRLVEEGRADELLLGVAQIVKKYLGGRFRLDLMERTTSEVPGLLREAGAPAEALTLSRGLLDEADLVKFARVPADAGRCRRVVDEARALIAATRPAEPRPEAAS